MDIGVALPQMATGLDAERIRAWCRAIDDGPFSSISVGERITFHNLDGFTLMSAAAALTDRVRIFFNVAVVPWYQPALLAKQFASLDVLSDGRLDVAVGVGGRADDYASLNVPFAARHKKLDESVAELKRLWAGGVAADGALVGPATVQPGGPRILCSGMGPKSLARAAKWADGVSGFSLGADAAETDRLFNSVRDAWDAAERREKPRLVTGVFVSLGPDAQTILHNFASRYLAVFGPELADALANMMPVHTEAALRQVIQQMAAVGADELILVPASSDPELATRLTDLAGTA